MPYKYRFYIPKSAAIKRHKRLISFLIFLLLIILVAYGIFIWYVSRGYNEPQPQSGLVSKDFNPLQTFETDYFSFNADKSWSFIEKESSKDVFVYRSSKNNIVSRDLTVYVNTLPQNLLLTRVLPVEQDGAQFIVGDVSSHCRDYLKDRIIPSNNNPIEGVVEAVSIKCQIDGTSTTVGTGKKNAGYQTELTSESGKNNSYFLLYHDLEFTPRLTSFTNIANSFKAK